MVSTSSPAERASLSQLRKAAGSKSLMTLQEAVRGWSKEEVNLAGQEGKTPLHMAAWKGCLENVRYLVEEMECDLDVYSKGEFSYGKTAIFFAATQSRADVLEYLLSRNPKVTIVNNKGQSVSSIASSHDMPPSILQKIRQLEHEDQSDWWNFRATHSDGLEYGDLDPRFLDRPLREDDVVTPWAVNPTTKETRKGGFARRNPKVARERHQQLRQTKNNQTQKNRADRHSGLTAQEEQCWEMLWSHLTKCFAGGSELPSHAATECLIRIVTLGSRYRRAWVPDAVEKLLQATDRDPKAASSLIAKSLETTTDDRTRDLLVKIQTRVNGSGSKLNRPVDEKRQSISSKRDHILRGDIQAWEKASMQVCHLSILDLEQNKRTIGIKERILTLPDPPKFVDTVDSMQQLKQQLFSQHTEADFGRPTLVAVDAEWYDVEKGENNCNHSALSTIQIAFCDRDTKKISTYVVDLTIRQPKYHQGAQELVLWILRSKNLIVLGFALSHDVHMLESFVSRTSKSTQNSSSTFLDIQLLLASFGKAALPGLKKCASEFSDVPLSKSEQCSKWGKRPLRPSQLEYAGLDAAILLILLSEKFRRQGGEVSV